MKRSVLCASRNECTLSSALTGSRVAPPVNAKRGGSTRVEPPLCHRRNGAFTWRDAYFVDLSSIRRFIR